MMVKQLTPQQSYQRLVENKTAVLIDVRSKAEYRFVGHPLNAIWIPWLDDPDWQPSPSEFVGALKDQLGDEATTTEILLICRSGQRSNSAGECLLTYGFSDVTNVVSGFEGDLDDNRQRGNKNGWRYDELPWEQS